MEINTYIIIELTNMKMISTAGDGGVERGTAGDSAEQGEITTCITTELNKYEND